MIRPAAEVGSTANSYQILAKLATGGMAEIFLARGASVAGVERYVVLKRILPDRATDVHFVRMFLDEARLAAQLQHPNIAQVLDIGKLGDSYFFTMEYVHGETVRSLLARGYALRRQLPLGVVLSVIAQTAAGLQHAHDRIGVDGRPLEIVHRDVSPSNLIASFDGHVKVVDFGVAKAADRMQETRAGTVKGKISYLSPEQCRGMPIDRRSDIFALGIVAWEMLTGERLYRRESDFENMTAIVTEATIPPSSARPDLPREVDALVMRMLEKDPARRFQRCDELVEAIEDVALRAQVAISTTTVGRMMKEMFGMRPEPWQELRALEKQPEVITVTSEPVPAQIIASASDNVRAQLASVIDLQAHRAKTEGLPIVPASRSSGSYDALPAGSRPSTANLLAPARRSSGRIEVQSPSSAQMAAASTGRLGDSAASTNRMGDRAMSGGDTFDDAPATRRPMWPIVLAIGVAGALVAIAVYLAMRGGSTSTPDAALVVIAPPKDAPVGANADGSTANGTDFTPTFTADAPTVPTSGTTSTNGSAEPRVDAGVDAPRIDAGVASVAKPTAFELCKRGAMTAKRAAECTVLACRDKAAIARDWYRSVPPSARGGVSAKCSAASFPIVPPTTPPKRVDAGVINCDDDPLACQH